MSAGIRVELRRERTRCEVTQTGFPHRFRVGRGTLKAKAEKHSLSPTEAWNHGEEKGHGFGRVQQPVEAQCTALNLVQSEGRRTGLETPPVTPRTPVGTADRTGPGAPAFMRGEKGRLQKGRATCKRGGGPRNRLPGMGRGGGL